MPRIAQVPIEQLAPTHRAALREALDTGRIHDPCMILTYAHSARLLDQVMPGLHKFPHMGFDETFGADFCELLRLRSGQIGGCASCQEARYEENSEELACAIVNPATLGGREQLGLRFLTLMHTDHHAIDDQFFAELAEQFTPAEIVELGVMISQMVGGHRLLSALDMFGSNSPVVPKTA